jgi:hypothetical protein
MVRLAAKPNAAKLIEVGWIWVLVVMTPSAFGGRGF